MTKDEASYLCKNISDLAADLLLQLNELSINPSLVDKFFLGILIRERVILKDISLILATNDNQQITSAFVLFRVLLDDFIRLFSVYVSNQKEEEVVKILADAHNHKFKIIEESIRINEEFYDSKDLSLATKKIYEDEKKRYLKSKDFEVLFKNKDDFKFKKISTIYDVIKQTKEYGINAHSYVVYKVLTQYVHYSNLTYEMENDIEGRCAEIDQIEEILLYAYKILCMEFEYFHNFYYSLIFNDENVFLFFHNYKSSN